MPFNQCNNNKLSTNTPLLFVIYGTALLINLCLFLPCLSLSLFLYHSLLLLLLLLLLLCGSSHSLSAQSCPAVQVVSSRSARCPLLPLRPTPALVPARRPTLKSACRGRPCRRGARPARAARGQTQARAQTRRSFTTAGCSTATFP